LRFWADLHIHSKYSIATSKDCDPENLDYWAKRKGLTLIGTGDFTHPAWRELLEERLEPAEEGFWRLKQEYNKAHTQAITDSECSTDASLSSGPDVRFVISGEISTIYKKNGKTRKVHHLILLPGFEEARRLSAGLEKIGNIRADGRPILGLDSRILLEMVMETTPRAIYIPAHIWTPHFSVFGVKSGFDSLEECYEDLTPEIMAVETGLSSDPAMNWRLSTLDRFPLISNSDAHSPRNLAREANLFHFDLSYDNLRSALKEPQGKFLGTIEFFPEEGKYHWDGHRSCGVQWAPDQTERAGTICPVCGKKVTVGVLHRVEVLADRPVDYCPVTAKPYERLVSLPKVIASAVGVGEKSKKVERIYNKLLCACGPELLILREIPLEEVRMVAGTLTAEGIRRVREGVLEIKPGFDGQYGQVNIFTEDERRSFLGQAALFEDAPSLVLPALSENYAVTGTKGTPPHEEWSAQQSDTTGKVGNDTVIGFRPEGTEAAVLELNLQQRQAVFSQEKRIMVLAGPGTGKTRTLLHRGEFLLKTGVSPREITCVTFTKKAAEELRKRLRRLLSTAEPERAGASGTVQVGTFHQLCLNLLNACPQAEKRVLLSEYETAAFLPQVQGTSPREMSLIISKLKNRGVRPGDSEVPRRWQDIYRRYQETLRQYQVMDFDEVLVYSMELLENRLVPPELLRRFSHLLVDEFQDLTPLQYRLVKLLCGESLFVIGDPDQSIYGFRGAESGVFQDFQRDFPEHEVIRLTQNYRSAPHILAAANHVISHNNRFNLTENRALALNQSQADPGRVHVFSVTGEKAEAAAVAQKVIGLVGGTDMLTAHGEQGRPMDKGWLKERPGGMVRNDYSFGEIAILYRTGRQLEALEEALVKEGLPYKVVGEKGLLYDKRIQETITFFHALLEPEDYLILSALHLSFFNLGLDGLGKLWGIYRTRYCSEVNSEKNFIESDTGVTFFQFLCALFRDPELPLKNDLPEAEAVKIRTGKAEIFPTPPEITKDSGLREKVGFFLHTYEKYLALITEAPLKIFSRWIADRKWDNQSKTWQKVLGMAALNTDLREFFTRIKLGKEGDLERLGKKGSAPEYINLMTLHAVKGLEYPVVFITGVEEGLVPLINAQGETELEEERRLFYVGMTRAKEELCFFCAQRRRRHGILKDWGKSRFIREIPQELLSIAESAKMRRRHQQRGLF